MKRIVCLILSTCLLLGSIASFGVAAESIPVVAVSCASECSANGQITVSVDLSGVTSSSAYCGISFGLVYDSSKFAYSSHTVGSVITGLGNVNPAAGDNEIYVNYVVMTPKEENGNIIKVTFDVLEKAVGEAEFAILGLKIKNVNYQNISANQSSAFTDIIPLPTPILRAETAKSTFNSGDSVTVNVLLENAVDYCGLSFGLVYDSDKLTYSEYSAGSVITGLGNVNPSAGDNEIYVNFVTPTPTSTNGAVVSVVFTAKDYINGNADFIIENFKLKNVSYQNIDVTTENCSVDIKCTHRNVEWKVIKAPQCDKKGLEELDCICGYHTQREIEKTEHSYISEITPPTCTDEGYTTYTCKICGDSYIGNQTPSAGHSYGQWTTVIQPSCEREGKKTRACTVCGRTEIEVIQATGHTYVPEVTPPTCTDEGYTTHTCKVCGDSYIDNRISPVGHSFGDWIVDREPTTGREGAKHRECSACDAIESESIPKLEPETIEAFFTLTGAEARPGETVKLTLSLKSTTEINSVAISNLEYDSDVLEFVGFGDYDEIEEMCLISTFDDSGYVLLAFSEPIMFDGDICTLSFRVKDDATSGRTVVTATPLVKCSSLVKGSTFTDGYVDVCEYIIGDIDCDKDVDVDDAVYLFGYSMIPHYFPLYYMGEIDFNHDEVIDVNDALVIFNHSMLPDIYPLS